MLRLAASSQSMAAAFASPCNFVAAFLYSGVSLVFESNSLDKLIIDTGVNVTTTTVNKLYR